MLEKTVPMAEVTMRNTRTRMARLAFALVVALLAGIGMTPTAEGQKRPPQPKRQWHKGAGMKISKLTTAAPRHASRVIHPTATVRLHGRHFGNSSRGKAVWLQVGSKTMILKHTRWRDNGIHVRLPSPKALGIENTRGRVDAAVWIAPLRQKIRLPPPKHAFRIHWHHKRDKDGDGHAPINLGGDDCDDYDPIRFPGNVEVADFTGHDEDCNPRTYGKRDRDGDGHTDKRVFNHRGSRGDDCDDSRREVRPGQIEACNNRDDNCDGRVDEALLNCPTAR